MAKLEILQADYKTLSRTVVRGKGSGRRFYFGIHIKCSDCFNRKNALLNGKE